MPKGTMKATTKILLCLCILACLPSCGKNFKDLVGLEAGARQNVEPATAAEIQAAILEYQKTVDEKVHASDRISYYYKMLGLEYMKKKMYGEAYGAYAQAIEISPQNANLYYYAGICAAYMSKAEIGLADGSEAKRQDYLSKAEKCYKRAIEVDPTDYRTMYALAVLYALELNRPEAAAPLIQAYIAKNEKDSNARFLLARVRYAQGRYEDAVALYDWIASNSTIEAERQTAIDDKSKAERMLEGGK